MMYVQYPEYTEREQLADLEQLDLNRCCSMPELPAGGGSIREVQIESFLGQPLLRVSMAGHFPPTLVSDGEVLGEIDAQLAKRVAQQHASEPVVGLGIIERDQWTVAGGYDAHRPLHHFAVADPEGSELYVSNTTGQVVLHTTRKERFWNWLGAVIHWLYPTQLRRHVEAWSQAVIWLSIAGTFLALTGIYVGIARLRNGTRSPYRGWLLWHHYVGLVFGVFTLTWMISGLLSMTPFGTFSGRDFSSERYNLRGGEMSLQQVRSELLSLDPGLVPADTVRLTGSLFAAKFAWIAWNARGDSSRLPSPLPVDELTVHARNIRPAVGIRSLGMIDEADAYYYDHHDKRRFPVLRIHYDDGERLYVDPVSGQLTAAFDSDRRWSRWLFLGLHRGDFAAWARQRPIWDIFMLFLMSGVTAGSISGVYLGFKRTVRWLRRRTSEPTEKTA